MSERHHRRRAQAAWFRGRSAPGSSRFPVASLSLV
ncbi:hypothetical protein ACP4OV_022638 [Aristida adscensionis]